MCHVFFLTISTTRIKILPRKVLDAISTTRRNKTSSHKERIITARMTFTEKSDYKGHMELCHMTKTQKILHIGYIKSFTEVTTKIISRKAH